MVRIGTSAILTNIILRQIVLFYTKLFYGFKKTIYAMSLIKRVVLLITLLLCFAPLSAQKTDAQQDVRLMGKCRSGNDKDCDETKTIHCN